MSTYSCEPTLETRHAVPLDVDEEHSMRSIFTWQTGQVLVTLGTLFKHVPPFNESIAESTSNTLISIGRKLKSAK